MYTLKSIVHRGVLVGAAASLAIATIIPVASVFADNLNPLTKRSLLLSSSAPGYQDTDGSGNSATNPNAWEGPEGNYYALPGSGPNGKKTGQTFSFNVSTDSVETDRPIKAFTLQYCTSAAGLCQAPGDNDGDARDSSRETNADAHPNGRSDLDVNFQSDLVTPENGAVMGDDFEVLLNGDPVAGASWTVDATNKEDTLFQPYEGNDGTLTGKRNFVTISTTSEDFAPEFDDSIEIVFKASDDHYITNPGSDEFFVKINTFDSEETADHVQGGVHNIDGGVTVANVMTESIHITTKVLETMSFSVGVDNPDLMPVQHGSCDAMQVDPISQNRLNLGNPNAEYSLETGQAFDVHSYWRLSSNSSGGATVYYSGDTLRNTVGDKILDMPSKAHSQPGTEQFGLALIDAGLDALDNELYTEADELENEDNVAGTPKRPFPANHVSNSIDTTPGSPTYRPTFIYPLNIGADYNGGAGPISEATTTNNAQFTFHESSKSIPEVIAENNDQVVSCATSKVRYIGNIAADTPAGVYTTKINFLAAPQY